MAQNASNPLTPEQVPEGQAQAGPPSVQPRKPLVSHEEAARRIMAAVGSNDTTSVDAPDETLPADDPRAPKAESKDGLPKRILKGAASIVTHPVQSAASAGRGAINALDATAETLLSTMKTLNPGGFERLGLDVEESTEFIDHANNAIFGPRSESGAQNFVEDTSNFLVGFLGAGKLKLVKGIKSLVVKGAVKGAVTDFVAYDPYQAQFAELAAQTHVPGVRDLGELLSVTGDDGPIAARAKRALGGAIPGVAIDGLLATARLFRSKRVVENPATTAAEKAAAQAEVEKQAGILSDIQDGTHVTDDAIIVAQTKDNTWEVRAAERRGPNRLTAEEYVKITGETREAQAARLAADETTHIPTRPAEELAAEAAEREAPLNAYRAKNGITPATVIEHDTRWAAEAQAATVNEALASRMAAKVGVTDETMQQAFDLAKKIDAVRDDPAEIVKLVTEARFNFTYMDPPAKVQGLLEATGEVLSGAFDRAQGRFTQTADGTLGTTWAESVERARVMAGMIPREEVEEFLHNAANVHKNSDATLSMMDSRMMSAGENVAKWAQIIEERPDDVLALSEARATFRAWAKSAVDVAGANSGIARGLNFLKNRGDEGLKDLKFKGEEGAAVVAKAESKEAAPDIIAGMTASEIRAVTSLFRLSKQPKVLFNAMNTVLSPEGLSSGRIAVGRMTEGFYNFMLSHPAVHQAVFISNAVTNVYEDAVRLMAGTATFNKELAREAADIMVARDIYFKQSVIGMGTAYKAGYSIIDPHPVVRFTPGIAGEALRTLGSRPMAAMDEFWRVNSNLAYVRAKAQRLARQDATTQGLKGPAFDKYVSARAEAAVSASIDPATGASRLPEAREFAARPTFSAPLLPGTFGADLEKLVKKHPFLLPVAPFMRTSVNVYRYSFLKNSPLGLFSKEIQQSLAKGGEEAAITATRMAVGTTIWGGAAMLGLSGQVTGNGPTNPQLRKMWLKTHQPYSRLVDGKWESYRRLDPFATPLSVMADLGHIMRDHGSDPAIAEGGSKVFYGIIASAISGMTNKTYLHGLVDFMNAIGSREGSKVKVFMDRMTTIPIPSVLQAFNTDPYLRETQGMFDAFIQKIPGWSSSLPAQYEWSGEPVSMAPSRQARTLFAIPSTPESPPMAEDELYQLQRALVAPSTIERVGKLSVSLHDRSYQSTIGSDLTPYERWMELVSDQDLRGQIDNVIGSSSYDGAGDGIDAFPGGRRYAEIRDRFERVYQKTRQQMLNEFPELKRELQGLAKVKRASSRSDEKSQGLLDRIR